MLSKLFLYGLIALAGAAFATRPGIDEVRALFRDRLSGQIADGSILPTDNGAAQALLAACQISPTQCARVLEGAVSMEYVNWYLWANVTARAPGFETLDCVGAFDRLLCL